MASFGGPNIERNRLVFGYDTGWGIANNGTVTRYYKGRPTSNIYGDISTSGGIRPSRTEYNTSNWTASFPAPPYDIGRVYKHTSGALNSTWSGNSYGYTLKAINCTAGATYVMSCWVYVSPDCDLSSFPCTTESTTSNNIAVTGFSQYYDLGNKGTWQRISVKCVSDGTVTFIPVYPRKTGVTDGSFTGFYAWGGAIVELGSYPSAYTVSSRSSTNSLFDLTGTYSINTGGISFVSTDQPIFDGTNDYLQVSLTGASLDGGCTIEGVLKRNSTPSAWRTFFNIKPSGTNTPFFEFRSGGNSQEIYTDYYNGTDYVTSAASFTTGTFCHAVATYDGAGNIKLYFNGQLVNTKTGVPAFALGTSPRLTVGRAYSDDRYTDIYAPVVKVYNRDLTSDEVTQNYLAYKNRFNL